MILTNLQCHIHSPVQVFPTEKAWWGTDVTPRPCWRNSRWFTTTPPTCAYVREGGHLPCQVRKAQGGAITRWISGAMCVSMLCASKNGRTVLILSLLMLMRNSEVPRRRNRLEGFEEDCHRCKGAVEGHLFQTFQLQPLLTAQQRAKRSVC